MSKYLKPEDMEGWICSKCKLPLVMKPAKIEYLGNAFPVDVPMCPSCGQIFIPEKLAIGKMAEVEQALEDK